MKKYEKPVVMINEELAEGVYAASGDCWTVTPTSVQPWNGTAHVFEIKIVHQRNLQHISNSSTVVLTFNHPISSATAQEYACTASGNTVTITRVRLGDAYESGDEATYKVFATAKDKETTEALAVLSATISCEKALNVQGGGGSELGN